MARRFAAEPLTKNTELKSKEGWPLGFALVYIVSVASATTASKRAICYVRTGTLPVYHIGGERCATRAACDGDCRLSFGIPGHATDRGRGRCNALMRHCLTLLVASQSWMEWKKSIAQPHRVCVEIKVLKAMSAVWRTRRLYFSLSSSCLFLLPK